VPTMVADRPLTRSSERTVNRMSRASSVAEFNMVRMTMGRGKANSVPFVGRRRRRNPWEISVMGGSDAAICSVVGRQSSGIGKSVLRTSDFRLQTYVHGCIRQPVRVRVLGAADVLEGD